MDAFSKIKDLFENTPKFLILKQQDVYYPLVLPITFKNQKPNIRVISRCIKFFLLVRKNDSFIQYKYLIMLLSNIHLKVTTI